ncbi:MAG: phosphate-starvation-inducible PsiE family protein [Hyphomicrobium sp.]
MSEEMRRRVDPIGTLLMDAFHFLGLFAIGAATFWSAAHAFVDMMAKSHASIEDLLLLFIYLEIGSMVGIYFKTNHMPLRFIVYVAITAVTRHLIGYVNHQATPDIGIVILAGAILILALAVLVIRYASAKYGSSPGIAALANLTDSESEAKVRSKEA